MGGPVRLESVEVRGWMPFAGTVELTLPAGPIAVVGSHDGDPRRSNRAGKTALLEAITWCLYGTHRKRLDDQVINRSVNACEVIVRMTGGVEVKRMRVRGSSMKLMVTTPTGELHADAAQQALVALIGLGSEDYRATSCFRQGEVELIIEKTATERLALVSEWLQQSRWIDAKKVQANKASAAEAALAQTRGSLEAAASYLLSEEQRAAIHSELGVIQQTREELDREMVEVSAQMLESMTAKHQLSLLAEQIQLRESLGAVRKQLQGRAEAELRKDNASSVEAEAHSRFAAAKEALEGVSTMRSAGFDGRCPVTCGNCPVADEVTVAVRASTVLLTGRTQEEAACRSNWHAAASELESAKRVVGEYMRQAARYQQIVQRGKEIATQLTMTEEQALAAPMVQPLQLKLEDLRRQFNELSQRSGTLKNQLESASTAEKRHAAFAKEVERAERSCRVSRLALRAISSVPAKIAAQQLTELESEANVLLGGTGVSLRFSWARELGDKAPLCEDCGYVYSGKRGDECPTCHAPRGKKRSQELELLCDDGSGAEEDARYNSGGTRAVVGAAIRLAASAMLRRLRSSQAAWAIVDEPFGSLDAENREQLARTFAGMLGHVGLEQALVVSHDPALLAALPHRIVVDKDGSSSTARVE